MRPQMPHEQPKAMPTEQLINELQSFGVRLAEPKSGGISRRGGAGPSDHTPFTIDGATVMVPVHNAPAFESPYLVERPDAAGHSRISRDGVVLAPTLAPVRGKPVRKSLRCRPDAAYLITGGMGALGLLMAGWLADRGARRLVLTGRTPLPPRRDWELDTLQDTQAGLQR